VALSRGNTTCRFIRDKLGFWGNTNNIYYIYTDNQASEHIMTQPTLNEHSRSIDIRHHAVRQAYLDGDVKVGGVNTTDWQSQRYSHQIPCTPFTRGTHNLPQSTQTLTTHGNKINATTHLRHLTTRIAVYPTTFYPTTP
jgi:hypothetical protein